jgi:hypothetical protein
MEQVIDESFEDYEIMFFIGFPMNAEIFEEFFS